MPAPALRTLLLVFALLPASAQDLPHRQGRLENGLTLVLLPRPGADTAVAAWASDQGAAADPPGRSGRAAALAMALAPAPVQVSPDGLKVQAALPAEGLQAWLQEQARALRPALLAVPAVPPRAPSDPLDRLRAFAAELALQPHPYGRPLAGWSTERSGLGPEDLRAAVAESLSPEHLLLVVAADLPWETLQAWAREAFGAWPRGSVLPASTAPPPSPLGDRRGILPTEGAAAFLAAWPAPPATHPDHAVFLVLADLLAGGRTAPLARRLMSFQGPAALVEATAAWPGAKGPSLFLVGGVTKEKDHLPAELGSAFQAEVQRLRQTALPEDALVRVRARARAQVAAWALDPDAAVAAVVEGWQQTGRATGALDLVRARLSVTPADVLRVARASFGDQDRVSVMLAVSRPAPAEPSAVDQELGRLLEQVIAAELPKDPIKVKEMVFTQLQLMQSLRPEEKAKVLEDLRRKVSGMDGRKP